MVNVLELKMNEVNVLSENDRVYVRRIKTIDIRQECYSVLHVKTPLDRKISKFGMRTNLHIDFGNTALAQEKVDVYFTSQNNALGAIGGRWRDGQVSKFELQTGNIHELVISKIDQYNYLGWKCSALSYYECMGAEFNRTLFRDYAVSLDGSGFYIDYAEITRFKDTCRVNDSTGVVEYLARDADNLGQLDEILSCYFANERSFQGMDLKCQKACLITEYGGTIVNYNHYPR